MRVEQIIDRIKKLYNQKLEEHNAAPSIMISKAEKEHLQKNNQLEKRAEGEYYVANIRVMFVTP